MSGARFHAIYLACLVVCAAVTFAVTRTLFAGAVAAAPDTSVYLVGAVTITDPGRLPEYQAIAGPLATSMGGYRPLAYAAPEMIEGKSPSQGSLFIERYDSLEGLKAFINSDEFREAKKLRDQVADVHFMLWLPAISPNSLPH